ncbi:hypothetical protein ACFLXE_05500 [Chloroflexota bacterium]
MKTISKDCGWAFLAAVAIGVILSIVGVEPMCTHWWILILVVAIAITLIVLGHWPTRDYSKEDIGIITPEGYRRIKPNIFQRIVKWLREN